MGCTDGCEHNAKDSNEYAGRWIAAQHAQTRRKRAKNKWNFGRAPGQIRFRRRACVKWWEKCLDCAEITMCRNEVCMVSMGCVKCPASPALLSSASLSPADSNLAKSRNTIAFNSTSFTDSSLARNSKRHFVLFGEQEMRIERKTTSSENDYCMRDGVHNAIRTHTKWDNVKVYVTNYALDFTFFFYLKTHYSIYGWK